MERSIVAGGIRHLRARFGWEERVTERFLSKDDWGDGAWQDEPDLVSWNHRGLSCLIVRHQHFGTLLGYVAVPTWHPFYGRSWGDIAVRVHGGLTYSGRGPAAIGFWIGFDAGHGFDYAPRMESELRRGMGSEWRDLSGLPQPFRPTYRDLEYIRGQVESLAEQIASAGRGISPRRANKARARRKREVRLALLVIASRRLRHFRSDWRLAVKLVSSLEPRARIPRSLRT